MARNNLLPLMIRLRQELNAPAETPEPVEVVAKQPTCKHLSLGKKTYD